MIQLVDAQQMAKAYPNSFEVPDQKELDLVKVGDSVKICINNKERLWIEVTEINGGQLKGKIDNCPIVIDDVAFGDSISFRKENIYSIFN
jgi:uncharacterized protein YegJ (DUF2314 family)